jgi:hypothetical protein
MADLAASSPRFRAKPAGVLGYVIIPRRDWRRAWLPAFAYTADRETARAVAAGMRAHVVTALACEVNR